MTRYYRNSWESSSAEDRKRKAEFEKFLAIIGIIIITIVFFCARNFIRDMNKFHMWSEGIKSIAILVLTNIVTYSFFIINNNEPENFFWSLIITFSIFCIYWHIVLYPKNKLYNYTIWQMKNYWWQFDGWEFEKEVAKLFQECGYSTEVTSGSNDGGVDIILYKDGIKTIVQCKHHRNPVSVEPIRALWGCMEDFRANEAIFIASSGYTSGCYDFVDGKSNYKLLSLDDIIHIASKLHGDLDPINNKNNDEIKENIYIVILPIYMLLCSLLMLFIYFNSENHDESNNKQIYSYDTSVQSQTNSIASNDKENNAGIGVTMKKIDSFVKIVYLTPNMPAYDAGIKIGDAIIEVDGYGINEVPEASARLRGKNGTPIKIVIMRDDYLYTYNLKRKILPSSQSKR